MFNLLLVDDSATDRLAVKSLLAKHEQFEIDTAEDGVLALEKMHARLPDLVVTDMQMPNMDGLQLVERVRALYPHVPVILITAGGSEELAALAFQRGAAGYVPKSRCRELLHGTIEHVIELTRSESSFTRGIDSATLCQFEFSIENDFASVAPLLELAQRMCAGFKICDEAGCVQVSVALEHAISNAICHGNLEMGTDLIGNATLLKQRAAESPYNNRRVFIEIRITREEARFLVRDEGTGFNVKQETSKGRQLALTGKAGRGLFLMWAFMDSVTFAHNGNTVVMIKRRTPRATPSSGAETKKSALPVALGIVSPRDGTAPISPIESKLPAIVNRLTQLAAAPAALKTKEKEFIDALGSFRDQLAYRLALEEAYGYFEEAIEPTPHIQRQSQQLRTQFAVLHERAQKLVKYAGDRTTRDLDSLSKDVQVLLHDLEIHDAAETEMVMISMFQDIGDSD